MIYTILLVTEVVLSAALITLILMQHGKGADAGAAFGSGASGTVFGARGAANFLSRTTAILATAFFVNCIALAYIVSHRDQAPTSLIDSLQKTSVPAVTPGSQPADTPAAGDSGSSAAAPAADIPEVAEPAKTAAEGQGKDVPDDVPDAPAMKQGGTNKKADIPDSSE